MKLSEIHQLENSEVILRGVHNSESCIGDVCTMHKMSNHPMRTFPQHWRSDRRLMERICPHGIGHPDPDDIKIVNGWEDGKNYELIHGCDGCCEGSY